MFIPPSSKIVDIMLDQKFFVFGKSEIYGRSFCKKIFSNTKFYNFNYILYITHFQEKSFELNSDLRDLNYSKSYSIYTHT